MNQLKKTVNPKQYNNGTQENMNSEGKRKVDTSLLRESKEK